MFLWGRDSIIQQPRRGNIHRKEAKMDRTTLATATSLTLMALLSIPLANAAGDPDCGMSAAVTKSQSDERSRTNGVDAKT
jgi:hypothetical protein